MTFTSSEALFIQANKDLLGVLDKVSSTDWKDWVIPLWGVVDQTGKNNMTDPFYAEAKKIVTRYDQAKSSEDEAGVRAAARDMANLSQSASQTLLGVDGPKYEIEENSKLVSLASDAPMGQAPPSVDNTLAGNVKEQAQQLAGEVAPALKWAVVAAVAIAVIVVAIKVKR